MNTPVNFGSASDLSDCQISVGGNTIDTCVGLSGKDHASPPFRYDMQKAPVGQMIVLETLAALVYAHLLRGGPLPAMTLAGAVLLVAGVVAALRIRPRPATAAGGV